MYPDLRELDADERCAVPGMTIGGQPAYLFSSRNQKTVSRHFRWMQQYGLDGVLAQRFVGTIRGKHADGDLVLKNIMAAAKESGRTFAIEYDISGGNPETFVQTLKDDWMYLVDELKVTSHPNYQRPTASRWCRYGAWACRRRCPSASRPAGRRPDPMVKSAPPNTGDHGWHSRALGTLTADSRKDPAWAEAPCVLDVVTVECRKVRALEAVDRWKEDVSSLRQSIANHQIYMPCISASPEQPETQRAGKPDSATARRVSLAAGVRRKDRRRQGAEDRDVRRGG